MNEASARPRGGNGKAIGLGILAMILGAALWAVITVVTEHEFSLVAVGIGALVGLTMFSARPTSTGIAAVAALLTVIGCALGEFLAIPAYVAHKEGIGFGKLINLELKQPKLYFDSLDGRTYLFWAIGAAAAFSMVFRRIQAARVTMAAVPGSQQPYGGAPQPGAAAQPGQSYAPYGGAPQPGTAAQPGQSYPAQQPYGAPQPGAAAQPYLPAQQPYGQEQAPYGQEQAPYGQGQQSYGAPQQPYGQQPGYGQQQAPPR
jgi:hypothetical protein